MSRCNFISATKILVSNLIYGGSAEVRTPDHLIKSEVLYQLSYRPKMDIKYYQRGLKSQLVFDFITYFYEDRLTFQNFYQIIGNIFKCRGSR